MYGPPTSIQWFNGWLEHPTGSKNYHSCACMPCDRVCIEVGSVSQPCCGSGMGWSLVLPKSRFYAFSIDLRSFMLVFFSWISKLLIVASHFRLCILLSLPHKVLSYLSSDIWKPDYSKTKPNLNVRFEAAASSWDTLWKNFVQDILDAKGLHVSKKEVDKNITLRY